MPPYVTFLHYGYVYHSNGAIVSNAKLEVITSVGRKVYTTNSDGIFMYDLAEIGYTSGETVKVNVTEPYNNEYNNHTFTVSGSSLNENITIAQRIVVENVTGYPAMTVLHSVGKKPITQDNPLPILSLNNSEFDLVNNPSNVWSITRSDGQPDSETLTLSSGDSYKRTFSYTNNILTGRSAWVKQ